MALVELILPEVGWGDTDPTRRQLVARAQNVNADLPKFTSSTGRIR